jgi:hypothetical protein
VICTGLLDSLKKPKWQSKYWKKRLEAVKELDDQEILIDLAQNDPDSDVRAAAVKKVNDKSVLISISENDPDLDVREAAVKRLAMSIFS